MKGRRSLFEVINKTPQIHSTTRSSSRGWLKRSSNGPSPLHVTEALTEEEALSEIRAQEVAREEEKRAVQAKLDEKRARLEAKREEKAARKAAKRVARERAKKTAAEAVASFGGPQPRVGPIRIVGGRLILAFNTTVCLVVAAAVCVLMLGSYSLGRRSAAEGLGPELSKAAAIRNGRQASDRNTGVFLGLQDRGRDEKNETVRLENADLTYLLEPPPARQVTGFQAGAKANQPVRLSDNGPSPTSDGPKLNYLEIQFFEVTRDVSRKELKNDLENARRFLLERGVQTFARWHPDRGYLLYAAEGLPPSKKYKTQREHLRRRIEQLGRAYRQAGGRYLFKGCYFVNQERAASGRPN